MQKQSTLTTAKMNNNKKGKGPNAQPQSKKNQSMQPKRNVQLAPISVGNISRTPGPRFKTPKGSSGDARIRVVHREYFADVIGSVVFNINSYPINPGLGAMFPWLAAIATNYESYRFHKLKIEYQTISSTVQPGSAVLAVDFDAADVPPVNLQSLMMQHNAVMTAPWDNVVYSADQKDLLKFGTQRYVRSGALLPNLDIKTYDVGVLFSASQDVTNTPKIGRLYVDYDIELMTPSLTLALLGPSSQILQAAGGSISTTNVSGNLPISTSVGYVIAYWTANVITFATAGQYILNVNLTGTTISGGITFGGTSTFTIESTCTNSSGTYQITEVTVNVLAGQTLTLLTGNFVTITAASIRVSQYAYSLS